MMSRWLFALFTAGVVVALPRGLLANDSERAAHPGPEALFKRLDANKDGQVTADEIPARAPDRLKAMLKRADTNGDEKLTAEELGQALRHSSRRLREAHSQRPDPKIIFARLDRDNDGQLNFAEFAVGMRQFHQHGRPPFAGRPGPPAPMHRFGPPPFAGRMLAGGMFSRADADHDGKVTLEEVPSERRERFARLLRLADRDGDKALSAEEAKRFAAAGMARARMAMAHRAIEARVGDTARRAVAARQAAEAQRAAAARRAASARQAVEARRSAASRKETQARGRNNPAAEKAAPPAKRPAADRKTPEAREKAIDAKKAAAAKRAAAKKAAEAKKKKRIEEARAKKKEAASSKETE